MSYEGESDDSDKDSQTSSIEDKDDISSSGGTSTSHFTSLCAPASDKNCFCAYKKLANDAFSYHIAPYPNTIFHLMKLRLNILYFIGIHRHHFKAFF